MSFYSDASESHFDYFLFKLLNYGMVHSESIHFCQSKHALSYIFIYISFEMLDCPFLYLLLQNHWADYNQFRHKHPWVKGVQDCSNKGQHLFQWEINKKYTFENLLLIFTTLSTKCSCRKRIKVYSKEWPRPFSIEDGNDFYQTLLTVSWVTDVAHEPLVICFELCRQ